MCAVICGMYLIMNWKKSTNMESFLKQVAADLYSRKGGNLAKTAVVFPNKRASLFFNEYLAKQTDTPIWSPAYISISDLFRELSHYEVADSVKLVCELYKIFRQNTQSNETLDDFYFWGELLISDFDDADKNMVHTDQLFTNLQELRAYMNDFTFMDEEQEAAIKAIIGQLYERCVEKIIPVVIAELDIASLVEEKVEAMDVGFLENLILSIMKTELDYVVNIGALIGFVIGCVNIII